MHQHSSIQLLSNHEIDRNLWDKCIIASPNGLIYARSFYLDNMCPGWKALAAENYDWVLPLTQRTKWGISYLYQPSFTQQLGVYARPGIDIPFPGIIECLQKHYSFCETDWNYAIERKKICTDFQITEATNFILNLNDTYQNLFKNYHNDLVKNLKRSHRFHHLYRETADYNKCIRLYKQYYASRLPMIKDVDYQQFRQMCDCANEHNGVTCREVVNKENEIMACALLLSDGQRLYNIMNTTTEAGRRTAANHFLVDAIIREFSGKDVLFDFEGSDVPGVRSFYENFGAVNQPFFRVKYNKLPWPLRLVKK